MSMEMHVLSPRRLLSIHQWQQAIDDLRFSIKVSDEVPIERVSGYLPVIWKDKSTGFECDHWSIEDIRETYQDLEIPNYEYALAFRWGGDFNELVAAMQSAAAYAFATDGVVFDCQEGELYSAVRSVEIARETEAALPQAEATMPKALTELSSKK